LGQTENIKKRGDLFVIAGEKQGRMTFLSVWGKNLCGKWRGCRELLFRSGDALGLFAVIGASRTGAFRLARGCDMRFFLWKIN
jgi:hypothetical protein